MKRQLVFSGCLLCAMTVSAFAADYAATPVEYDWSGFYIGANAGWAWTNDFDAKTTGTETFETLIPGGFVPAGLSQDDNGFSGGAQAGYNWQTSANFLIGIEADINWADLKSSDSFTGASILGTQLTTSNEVELNALATLRARLGFTADRSLFYITGGVAFGDVDTHSEVNGVQAPSLNWSGSQSDWNTGYSLGGGFEYALTDNITSKIEYLYTDLGDQSTYAAGNAAVRSIGALDGIDYRSKNSLTSSVARVGLNFRF
jgi:outer membrane immunogenic protein